MSLIKKIKRFNGTTWEEFNIAEAGSNLQNGEGLDSLIQIYSGEVDDTHFSNTALGESAAVFGEANTVGANRALSAGKLNVIQVTAANSITGGLQNNVIGAHDLTVGAYNDNRGIEAIMAGAHNYSVSVAGITAGHNNENYSAYSLLVGTNNVTRNNDGIIVGGHWSKDNQGLLMALGNGTDENNRSNAFEVLRDGSAIVYPNQYFNYDNAPAGTLIPKSIFETKLLNTVSKSNVNQIIYGTGTSGLQVVIPYTHLLSTYSLMFRDSSGCTFVGDPIEDGHAATKKYVDNVTSGFVKAVIPSEKNVYYFPSLSVNKDNTVSYWSIKGTPEPSGEKVVIRSKQGRAQMQDPVEDMDIANKQYVDGNFVSLTDDQTIFGTKIFLNEKLVVSDTDPENPAVTNYLVDKIERSTVSGIYELLYPNKRGTLAIIEDVNDLIASAINDALGAQVAGIQSVAFGGLRYDYAKYKVYQNLSIILNENLYEGEYYVNSETGAKYCTIGGVNLIDEALNEIVSSATIDNVSYSIEASIDSTDDSLVSLKIKDTYVTIENEPYVGRTASSAEGNQAFVAGGSVHAYGDWSAAIGKDNKAYQKASFTVGGSNQSGMTEEEFNARFSSGTDWSGKTYNNSYSFAFTAGESNKALGRSTFAAGSDNIADKDYSAVFGMGNKSENPLSFTIGKYANTQSDDVFTIGWGDNKDALKSIFTIKTNGDIQSKGKLDLSGDLSVQKTLLVGDHIELTHQNGWLRANTVQANIFNMPYPNGKIECNGATISRGEYGFTFNGATTFNNVIIKSTLSTDGDVTIGGNLTVEGTTSAVDVENLRVEDNVIVANTTGMSFNNAGFAIMTGADTTYGIMYNPTSDGVMIGEGIIGDDGEFAYADGESQYLATVDWTIADGNIAKWDATKKTFVDSAINVDVLLARIEALETKVAELESNQPRIVRL